MRNILHCSLLSLFLFSACATPKTTATHIRIAVPYELSSLDPHARNTISDFAVLSNFYEPLVTTDSNMTLQPCLARQWENPDLSTWTFHLQNGVRFHSGKALTAEDVVYSIQRVVNSTTLEMSGYVSQIKDVKVVGPLSVQIRTKQPMSVLLNKIRFVLIIPKGTDTSSLRAKVDGTGPYRFLRWHGSFIEMKANENYWRGTPDIRDVTYDLGQSPGQALQALLAGTVQLVQADTKDLESAIRNRKYTMYRTDSFFLKYIGYDLSRKQTKFSSVQPNPFLDKRVREAIHIGLDRQALVNALTTYAAPATQPLPPFIFGYNPQITAPRGDQKRAKALLEAAGLGSGFKTTMHVRKIFEEAALLVRDQLSRIGIDVTIESLPDNQFFALVGNRGTTLHLSRFGCPTGDASDILDNAIHSTDPSRHLGGQNYEGYNNTEVDRAIEESGQILDVDRRKKALQKIMDMLMADLVWIPLYIDQDVYAIQNNFQWSPRRDSFLLAAEIHSR